MEKYMKRGAALLLAALLAASLTACSASSEDTSVAETTEALSSEDRSTVDEEIQAGSVDLTVMMPLGQWTDNFDILIDSYRAEHPEIGEIEATFPSSDKYQDLLKADLAAGSLPDIISISYGIRNEEWKQYCVDLSTDCPAYDLLTDDQIAIGMTDYGMIYMPLYVEGTGILYNMKLLADAGWDHTPQTRDELAQLCADLVEAGIRPFMHQWSEVYLNLFNWVGTSWLGNKGSAQMDFLDRMLSGEDMHLEDDPEWNDFMDTYEILIEYAQDGAIATDKWTCRNAFFLEECAMLVGEGSWETPNIIDTNPELLDHVQQDVLPCSNIPGANNLQIQTISAEVTDSGDPLKIKYAKDFLSYIASSEAARIWHQDLMGNPTSIVTLELSENLPKIPSDVVELMQKGNSAESLYTYMPAVIESDIEEAWARFVAQNYTRDEFTARYQEIFADYAAGKYN